MLTSFRFLLPRQSNLQCCAVMAGLVETQRNKTTRKGVAFNWSLKLFCYSLSVREAFARVMCLSLLVVACLAGCTAPLSQPEARQATAPDPLISPPASLMRAR